MVRCVSVIIPAFNAVHHLGEALESVRAQTCAADEVIVIDDGSTDGTGDVVARFGDFVTCHRQPRAGAAAARNHGARLASGSHLTFLDADDVWEPTKLERQLRVFDQRPAVAIVFGRVVQFTDRGEQSEPMDGYHPGTMMLRRTTFEAIGEFREDQAVGDFIDWYARAVDAGLAIEMLPDVVMRRRLHDTNMGRHNRDRREEYARVLRTVIDRRRLAGS